MAKLVEIEYDNPIPILLTKNF